MRGEDLGNILFQDDGDDDDEDYLYRARSRRQRRLDPDRFPKVPSEEGTKLMHSGVFGSSDWKTRSKKQLARRVLDRELGLGDRISRKMNQEAMAQVSVNAPGFVGRVR